MIIENKSQLDDFLKGYSSQDSIIIPIQNDENKHPIDDDICLLYIQLMDGSEFVLPINHSESLNIDLPDLDSDTKKFTTDKKYLQHLLPLKNVIDVNLVNYCVKGVPLSLEEISTNAHNFFQMTHYKKSNINKVIPILKHIERCRKVCKVLKTTIERHLDHLNEVYNEDILKDLGYIESNGLQTNDGMVYSEYNIFTSTGRPSNRFGGINFAALNKKDGSREKFISRFGGDGVLVEMDFDAYHLRLIADKINYEFPQGSVHEHMAQFYGVDYEEAKRLSFQYLYGYIPPEVVEINPYFSMVGDYINNLWNDFNDKDFVESDIYMRRIFKSNLSGMNANKLFNYTIQLMETENNMRVLNNLIPQIKDFSSKLILYSYDSFLLDFNMKDGLDYLKKVKQILEQDDKYPVKVSWGINYHEMKDITEKFV
tara:strand:- start:59 stop:1336 length:1278 start_codon:yes stop_codon:yes gene_type:complete